MTKTIAQLDSEGRVIGKPVTLEAGKKYLMNPKKGGGSEIVEQEEKQRTEKQNNALHLWFQTLADELNRVGFEQQITIGTIDVPWNEKTVKWMYKKVSRAQFDKGHTADLTTKELNAVSDTLNRLLASKGINVPFPSAEELMWEQRGLKPISKPVDK